MSVHHATWFWIFRYEVFDTIILEYDKNGNLCNKESNCKPEEVKYKVNQTLWPDHCVKNTLEANVSTKINLEENDIFIKKGSNCDVSM